MAAPAFGAAGTPAASTSNSVSPTLPSGIQANDIIFILAVKHAPNTSGTLDINTPSGYSAAAGGTLTRDFISFQPHMVGRLFWKRATGSESGTVALTGVGDTGADTVFYAQAYRFTGAATSGDPWDSIVARGYQDDLANIDLEAITVSGSERTLIGFGAYTGGQVAPGWASYTSRNTVSTNTGQDAGLSCYTKDNVSSDGSVSGSNAVATNDFAMAIHVALKPVVSGNQFTQNLADTITLSDSPAKAVGPRKADTITLTDARSWVWTILRSLADTITTSDAAAKSVGVPRSDTVTLTDAHTKTVGARKDDTITLSDAFSRTWVVARTLADTVALSDAVSKAAGVPRTDTITLSDLASPTIVKLLALADTITLTDSPAKRAGVSRADTLTLSDSFARTWAAVRTLADTLNLSDQIGKAIATALADTIGTSDALGKRDVLARADSVSLTDAVQQAYGLARADAVTLSDNVARGLGLGRADTITLSDAVARAASIARADTITLSDEATPTLTPAGGLTLNLADTITLMDAAVKTLGLSRADVIALADDTARALNGQFQGGGQEVVRVVRRIVLNRFGIH